jgi:hypothetical protein
MAPPHRTFGDPQIPGAIPLIVSQRANRSAASSRSLPRRRCSAGAYPARCAYHMLRSYAGNDPTSRPKLYELILVSRSAWSPNDGAPDNPIKRGMDRDAYRPRQTPERPVGARLFGALTGASQSRMAYWMVVSSVYSCIVTLGVNIRFCRSVRDLRARWDYVPAFSPRCPAALPPARML